MFGLRKPARRFSQVLLEEGEDNVADWVAQCHWPETISGNWQSLGMLPGTLRLCSKSLFFEPDDVRVPIVRLPFKATQNLEPEGRQSFTLITSLVVKMKANMADAPYIFEKGKSTTWRFVLVYAQMADFLPVVHQYLAASRLSAADCEEALQVRAQNRAKAAVFDTSRMVNFTEAVQYDAPATQHAPLVKELGRLVITEERIYFQPLDSMAGDKPVRIHSLAGVAAVARRRSALRPIGLELFFIDGNDSELSGPTWGAPSAFFAFDSEAEREKVLMVLMEQASLGEALPGGRSAAAVGASVLEAEGGWLQKVTHAWQHGRITNLDYLLFCNLAAGRSFNDLTQWPVFPWVLADYDSPKLDLDSLESFRDLSLPMGAINARRLAMVQKRFQEMPRGQGMDPPFLYGTHYSCPGYVMFWLVRAAPGHLLRLQNGRFDAPDRLFINLGDSYQSASSSPADVKELIPEFYLTDPTFLINREQLPLGIRQNGLPVGDVELPAWASNPVDFLIKHRAALESAVVSANLHHWIDLIFGYKQQGAAAEESDNVFHYLTYEGAVDVSSITDARHRQAIEVQINEFGQCPKQIFKQPHPSRLVCPSADEALAIGKAMFAGKGDSRRSVSQGECNADGRTLSLALLTTIMAATTTGNDADKPINPQDQERLQKLDLLALRQGSRQQADDSTASASTSEAANPVQEASGRDAQRGASTIGPSSAGTTPRKSAETLRGWGNNIGGQLSTFVGNLKDRAASSPGGGGPHSRLRGLFQRQGGPAGPVPPGEVQGTSATAAAVQQPSSTEPCTDTQVNDICQGDYAAEELASALGIDAIATLPSTMPSAARPGGQASPPNNWSVAGGRDATMSWGCGVRERLRRKPRMIATSHTAPVTGITSFTTLEGAMLYCVSQAGTLKIFSLETGTQVRAASFGGMPLTSVTLLPPASTGNHPTVISGCFDNKVYAYSVEYGRILGNFSAHDDTVSCLQILASPDQLMTGSYDGAVKLWSLAEGREPWRTVPALPQAELESDSTICSVSAAVSGDIIVTGSEEGSIAAWDLRSEQSLWQAEASTSGIISVNLTPDNNYLVAAAADGNLSLLEMRKAGALLSRVHCAAPLKCCQTDGSTALAGSQDGQVYIWDIAQQQGRLNTGGFKAPSPDGLYPCLTAAGSAVTCLYLATQQDRLNLSLGHEDGKVAVISEATHKQ